MLIVNEQKTRVTMKFELVWEIPNFSTTKCWKRLMAALTFSLRRATTVAFPLSYMYVHVYAPCFTGLKNSEATYPACRKRRLLGTYQLQSDC